MSTFALASEAGEAGTDIVQRTVNFILFAGLIWYLIAEPVKNYFNARSQAIADKLNQVQERLNETAALKQEALEKVSEAKKFAEELAVLSKKESKILGDNIMAQCEADLEVIAKQFEAKKELAERKMVASVVEEVMDKVLQESSKSFDKKAMANVILKKVA
ncbi:ATP synthase F0 sector subunit b [hydrothermal vent metagenome]|uniref:ATP synthase F0 sector subunit b n=1 Tax=hydrothermal vent metagenome TaxID=652676 RepID=A0A1W1D2Y1_9ZZZZ